MQSFKSVVTFDGESCIAHIDTWTNRLLDKREKAKGKEEESERNKTTGITTRYY